MKGNIKNKIRSLIFIAVFMLSAMFVCVGILPHANIQHQTLRALHEIYEGVSSDNSDKYKKVSAISDGNILLSVEKVWIALGDDALDPTGFESGSAYTSENKTQKEIGYVHIPEKNGFKKSIIADGSYVMIENDLNGKSTLDNKPGENASEALVISFGQYYINTDDQIKYASGSVDNDIANSIQRLQVNATLTGLDGKPTPINLTNNVRDVGTVGQGGYQDYAYVLDYENLKEGKYEFSFDYFTEHSYSTTFSFYVMKQTSYSGLLNDIYTQAPTLGWNEDNTINFEKPETDGCVQYYVGENGFHNGNLSFPTITYDYTRYTFRYTHTAKNETSEYVFVPNLSSNTITFTKNGVSQETVDARYDADSDKHIVTVVLTEPGQYDFKFEYIYLGDTSAATEMNLKIADKKLHIHDTKLLYKKTDFKDAVMSNLSMSDNEAHNVALIVPNAVQNTKINNYKNQRLEMVYELDIKNTLRVGDIDISKSHTGLANFTLGQEVIETIEKLEISGPEIKLNNVTLDDEMWNRILNNIPFEKTNFSALKFDITDAINSFNPSNGKADKYDDGELTNEGLFRNSYYYYSKTKPTAESLSNIENYTHYSDLTTFNKIGYYIVVLRMSDYTQIFAFEYTSNSTNANITDVDGNPVGDFTNKDIKVNWTPNAIFEREISAVYYELKDDTTTKGMTSNEIIDQVVGNYNSTPIKNGDPLTSTTSGHFTKYVIELKKEGASSSCKMAIVDKQDITGIEAHAVLKIITADNSSYYKYATNSDGSAKIIQNLITDSYATLKWNHKESGAKVKITYSFTPFKVYNFGEGEDISVGGGFKTNYRLGSTINGSELIKGEDSTLNYSSLVDEQGIYVFTAEDQAGNITKYMLIIDQTEAYYKVTDSNKTSKFVTNESLFYSDDVRVDIGSFKAIYLYDETLSEAEKAIVSDEVKNIIANINNDSELNNLQFYKDEDYRIRIANLFSKDNDSNLFIKVAHKELKVFDINKKEIDFDRTDNKLDFGGDQKLGEGEYSIVYRYYVKSNNNLYSGRYEDYNSSNSKLTIEVNADNSQGFVYFSDAKTNAVPKDGQSGDQKYRLYAGNNNDKDFSGIEKAEATSSSYVGFVWNMGSDAGAYKVASVTYSYYPMDLTTYDEGGHYFTGTPTSGTIYESGEFKTANIQAKALNDEAGRAFVWFGTSGTTAPGLYIIERTYAGDVPQGSKDSKTLYYFFIVDRTGIIDSGVGDGIYLEMLIDGTKENDFKKPTTNAGTISVKWMLNTGYEEKNPQSRVFKKYLTTSKVPTTIRIPAGKFYKYNAGKDTVQTSANYYAGQLSFTLYYIQTHDQVYDGEKVNSNTIIKLLTSNAIAEDGYFTLDLTKIETKYNELFIDEHGDWVYLPGTYVIEIKDNVQNVQFAHNYQYIGFVIEKGQAPQTDINTGFDESNLIATQPSLTNNKTSEYKIVTSDEFVHVELPEYIEGVKNKPQIDVDYIEIKRNGETILDSVSLQTDTLYTIKHDAGNPNGAKTITLPTDLRDVNGNVVINDSDEDLVYTIKVRYKLHNGTGDYTSAYKYVTDSDSEFRNFYETTYTIIIDRLAPQGNINNLVNNDSLLKQYYQDLLNEDTIFENTYQETGENSKIYFFTRYEEYYKEKDISKLYAFNVVPETDFVTDDVSRVLFRKLDEGNYDLSLPIISENGYTSKNSSKITTYGDLFGKNPDGTYVFAEGYYEIVEIDYAGNTTQYVILYNTQENLQFNVNYKATNGKQTTKQLTNTEDVHLYMFEITGLQDESFAQNSHFMRVEMGIANGEVLVSESLNFSTNVNDLITNIVSKITKTGTYNLKFVYRARTENDVLQLNEHTVYISLYSEQDKVELNANKVWSKTGTGYIINLQGANEVVDGEAGRITYFATKVIIKYTYNKVDIVETYTSEDGIIYKIVEVYTSEDGIVYKNKYGINVETTFACWPNTSYRIELIDLFEQSKTTMFNTGDKNFFNIEFARPGNLLDQQETGNYYLFNGKYYAYTDLKLSYDSTLFTLFTNQTGCTLSDPDETGYRTFEVEADGKNEFKVWFEDLDNAVVQEYFFVLDNTIGEVLLIDFNNADKKEMAHAYNVLIEEMKGVEKTYSGIMNLTWTVQENDYFDYEYILYEVVNAETGERTITDLTGKKAYTIQTDKDMPGIYYFEVNVYSKPDENGNRIYLGNKLYAFNVLSENNRLYYIEKDGVAISHNSSITIQYIKDNYFPSSTNDIFKEAPTSEIPLFISNTELKVVANDDYVKEVLKIDLDFDDFYLALYKISSSTYPKYLALLIVKHDANIISNLKVNNNLINEQQDIMIVKTPTDTIQDIYITGTKVYNNKILSKNLLTMEIYYNGININQTVKFQTDNINGFSYKIPGNGQYMFVFKDLAGNVYEINPQASADKTLLRVEVLRELTLYVNGELAIENALYNKVDLIEIYSSLKFATGTISINVYKNGSVYKSTTASSVTIDPKDYGTYKVVAKASYQTENMDQALEFEKTIKFTIINGQEVRPSINLNALYDYSIAYVTTSKDVKQITSQEELLALISSDENNVTETFKSILNERKMFVHYDNLKRYSQELNLVTGKQEFTIIYMVEENGYPTRYENFTFTLNNEVPKIECSLPAGETTTDGFDITFNSSIIYQQIGECYIKINGVEVTHIVDGGANHIQTIHKSFAQDGAGTFLITLESPSGNIWYSYNAVIKEPLNTWAIVIIVIVAVAVIGVTITIIVLRNKMRIR